METASILMVAPRGRTKEDTSFDAPSFSVHSILIGSVPVAVSGAVVLILGIILKYWEQIKGFFQKGIDWLRGKSDDIHKKFGDTIGTIYDMFVNNLQSVLNIFDSFFKMIKGIFDGIITFVKLLQFSKAFVPIFVTPSGIVTLINSP